MSKQRKLNQNNVKEFENIITTVKIITSKYNKVANKYKTLETNLNEKDIILAKNNVLEKASEGHEEFKKIKSENEMIKIKIRELEKKQRHKDKNMRMLDYLTGIKLDLVDDAFEYTISKGANILLSFSIDRNYRGKGLCIYTKVNNTSEEFLSNDMEISNVNELPDYFLRIIEAVYK